MKRKLPVALGLFGLVVGLLGLNWASRHPANAGKSEGETQLSPEFLRTIAEMEAKVKAGTDTPQDAERLTAVTKKETDRLLKIIDAKK